MGAELSRRTFLKAAAGTMTLADDFKCPLCGFGKSSFEKVE